MEILNDAIIKAIHDNLPKVHADSLKARLDAVDALEKKVKDLTASKETLEKRNSDLTNQVSQHAQLAAREAEVLEAEAQLKVKQRKYEIESAVFEAVRGEQSQRLHDMRGIVRDVFHSPVFYETFTKTKQIPVDKGGWTQTMTETSTDHTVRGESKPS